MANPLEAVISVGVAPNSQLTQQVTGVVKQINNVLTSGMVTVASVLAPAIIIALGGITKSFALEIEKVRNASERLNLPVEQLDAWTGAANMAGVSTDAFIATMDSLHSQMVSAARFQGGGLLQEMMRGYMPQIGNMDAVEDYLLAVSDAIKGISKVEANRELSKIGINDPRLQHWLRQGSSALKAQIELSKKLGVITEEDTLIADRMNFAMRATQRAFERALLPLFRMLAPILENISKALLTIKDHWEILIPILIAGASKIGASFAKMALGFVASHPILTVVIGALVALGIALEDLLVWMEGGESQWGSFWEKIFGSPENVKATIKKIEEAFLSLKNIDIKGFIENINWADIGYKIGQKLISGIKWALKKLFNFKEWMGDALRKIDWKELGLDILKGIVKAFVGIGKFLAGMILGATNGDDKEAYNKFVKTIGGWDDLVGALMGAKTPSGGSTHINQDNSVVVNVDNVNSEEQAQNVANRVSDVTNRQGRISNEVAGSQGQGG